MSDPILHILQHALGRDEYGQLRRGATEEYRNHYVAGGDAVARCREAVAKGWMVEREASPLTGGDPVFFVTDAGRQHVLKTSPKPPMTSDDLLAKADADPRVIEARARLQRGEISRQRFHQIRRRAAGLCVSCRRAATNGDRCEHHPKSAPKRDPATLAARNERLKRERREERGLPPDAVLLPGGKGVKRKCKQCGKHGHFAKTCTEGK